MEAGDSNPRQAVFVSPCESVKIVVWILLLCMIGLLGYDNKGWFFSIDAAVFSKQIRRFTLVV